MARMECPKRTFKRPDSPEDMQALRDKARTLSFAELADQDEIVTLLFKTYVVAAEHMDEIELLRKDGKQTWTGKLSGVRVGFWKALENWAKVAHPDLLAKPVAPKSGKKSRGYQDDDEDEEEPAEAYVPDLTMPSEPVDWKEILVWHETEDFPAIRDTGYSSEEVNSQIDEGWSIEKIMRLHPMFTMRDIVACQEFDKIDQPAREKYEKEFFDKSQTMSPLHPNFVVAPWYPKTPIAPMVPGRVVGGNDGPMTLPTRRGLTLPAILLAILALAGLVGFGIAVRGWGAYNKSADRPERVEHAVFEEGVAPMTDEPKDSEHSLPSRKPSPIEFGRIALRGIASVIFPKNGGTSPSAKGQVMIPSSENADVVSLDTKRQRRIPPGQVETRRWPVLHAGPTPNVDLALGFEVDGSCRGTKIVHLGRIQSFADRAAVFADMHCVTTWSMLDNLWEGVAVREVLKHVKVKPEAKYVLVHAENGFSTNLPLADFDDEDCLFAWSHNGKPLDADHGRPLRLVVPKLYAWKSAKWVRGIEFLPRDRPGFWEQNGYHNHGDPWTEERYW